MKVKKFTFSLFVLVLCTGLLLAFDAPANNHDSTVKTDAETAAELGLLLGDGNGVNAAYLSKKSTRMQAAIISLRLQGLLKEAMTYPSSVNFSDADQVSTSNKAILAYLKNHPEHGWSGTGNGHFNPSEKISSQQFYKVLLEILGYQSGKDFIYAEAEPFAAARGLQQISSTPHLTNAHIATALIEALSVHTSSGATLFATLQSKAVIPASAMLPDDQILLRNDNQLGTFFTDKNGRTLYFFTKDAENPNSCQEKCLSNWPIFYAEHLQIPGSLNPDDFSVLTRSDGAMQTTYKGFPLYYFVGDTGQGDIKGQNVNKVWFVINPATFNGTSAPQEKTYHVAIKEFSFGTEPLTIEAGSKVVFTNYDDMKHNAVALDGSFATPLLSKGESYTVTFDKAGTYGYFCEPHKQFMTGNIIVK